MPRPFPSWRGRVGLALAGVCLPPCARAAGTVLPVLPFKRDAEAESLLVQYSSVLALLLLVLLLALAFALARRGGYRFAGGRQWSQWNWRRALKLPAGDAEIRIVATRRLDARSSLHVIDWEGSRLLIGRSDQGLTLLGERPAGSAASPGNEGDRMRGPAS